MSDKQVRKDAKRKKRKAAQARARNLRELESSRPREKSNWGPTPPNQMLETMLSPDIPESEWPDDLREEIALKFHQLEEMGQTGHVKRRPDGTYTVMGDTEWIGREDMGLD